MKFRFVCCLLVWMLFSLTVLPSCSPSTSESLLLASFTQNYVQVSIHLERNPAEDYFLAGTFLPPEEYHLYSKDIPPGGVNGLGRPTLLELGEGGQIKATGALEENVRAQEPDFEPRELFVYPAGPVTLRLPIQLPLGDGQIYEELRVTYMACSAVQCKAPVEGKIVQIILPGPQDRP